MSSCASTSAPCCHAARPGRCSTTPSSSTPTSAPTTPPSPAAAAPPVPDRGAAPAPPPRRAELSRVSGCQIRSNRTDHSPKVASVAWGDAGDGVGDGAQLADHAVAVGPQLADQLGDPVREVDEAAQEHEGEAEETAREQIGVLLEYKGGVGDAVPPEHDEAEAGGADEGPGAEQPAVEPSGADPGAQPPGGRGQ